MAGTRRDSRAPPGVRAVGTALQHVYGAMVALLRAFLPTSWISTKTYRRRVWGRYGGSIRQGGEGRVSMPYAYDGDCFVAVTIGLDGDDGDSCGSVRGVWVDGIGGKYRHHAHVRAAYNRKSTSRTRAKRILRPTRLSTLEAPIPCMLKFRTKSSSVLSSPDSVAEHTARNSTTV